MMKTLFLSLLLLANYFSEAQIKKCNTYESMLDFRSKHPGAETDAQFEAWLSKEVAARQSQGLRTNIAYTIPVIFHIIHNGEAVGTGTNLSAATIQQQLNQLNSDYANLSGSIYGVAANTEISFCLAVVGADGRALAEPGIERINRNTKGWTAPPYDGFASNSYVDATIIPNSIWNPYNYFNIWTLDLGSSLLGKATFPTSSTLSGLTAGETDTHAGVFVHYNSVGSVASPGGFGTQYGLGRTLTHEAGHWLGLRHIWGDGTCATDYCNDTPPQSSESSGCPTTGTLNGCTPSVAKMFENYMDYTDDACVNTFTADQKIRIQTVMANSPRRVGLSTAGSCTTPSSNSIRFTSFTNTVSESATVFTCPQYRDVVLTVNVYNAANGNATVTFTKTGTATDNVDYTIIPASVNYTNGDNTSKNVTVRIWDDGAVESAETITLGYTISGTGVTAAAVSQTSAITINDNDATPIISNTGNVSLLNEDFTSGGTGWVAGTFGAPGANLWTVSANGGAGITGNAAHITNDQTLKPLQYTVTSTSNSLFVSPLINGTGKYNATLSFKYKCDGEIDNGTLYDYGTIMYSLDGTSFSPITDAGGNEIVFQGVNAAATINNIDLPSVLDNANFYLGFRWRNDNSVGTDPPFLVDDIVVSVPAVGTEGQAGHTGNKNIFSSQNVYIYSTNDNQVIARINNASANIGCLTATIGQAGSGTTTITNNNGSFLRTQKVINLVPASPNSTVTYQGTLYFSSAELAAWGVNKLNLRILQVQDGVSLGSTITSANAKVITPTSATEDVANGVIAYTGNFTGFSQFMLVSPTFTLPVGLLTFEAQPAKKNIELTWKTAQEKNNKGFVVERSINGADFTAIGWVTGVGTTDDASFYKYNDNFVQPNTVYYYRLKQTDFDNRTTLSNIRQAKIAGSGLTVTISPNPVKGQMTVFVSGTTQPADISLINAKGQTVGKWTKAEVSSPYAINMDRFAKGYYTVIVSLPDGEISKQVIIQ